MIRACEQAVALDEKAWHAFYLLSLSHMDLKHEEMALSFAGRCLNCCPSDLVWTKSHYRFLRHLAESKCVTGDDQGAYSVMALLLQERLADLRAFQAYVRLPDDKQMWNDCNLDLIGEVVNTLNQSRSTKFDCSKMSEGLLDDLVCDGLLQDTIIRSLRAANKLPLGVEILVHPAELRMGTADDSSDLSLNQQQVRYRGIASLTRYTSARLLKGIDDGDRSAQMSAYGTLQRLWDMATYVSTLIPIWLWFQRHCWYHCFLGASKMHDIQCFEDFWSVQHHPNAVPPIVSNFLGGRAALPPTGIYVSNPRSTRRRIGRPVGEGSHEQHSGSVYGHR